MTAPEANQAAAEVYASCVDDLLAAMRAYGFEAWWLADVVARWETRASNLRRGAA